MIISNFPGGGASKPKKKAFVDCTWEEVSQICKKGYAAEYWSIGDEKPMHIGGSANIFRIIGFDHDPVTDASAYGREKAGITLEMVDPPSTLKKTWAASNAQQTVWNHSVSGGTLNYFRTDYLPNFLNSTVIEALRNVIVPVNKEFMNNSGQIVLSSDTLFILSVNEIKGTYASGHGSEGEQYAYYAAGNSHARSFGEYWTRSKAGLPSGSMGHAVYTINSSGAVTLRGCSDLTAYGIPCLCI